MLGIKTCKDTCDITLARSLICRAGGSWYSSHKIYMLNTGCKLFLPVLTSKEDAVWFTLDTFKWLEL